MASFPPKIRCIAYENRRTGPDRGRIRNPSPILVVGPAVGDIYLAPEFTQFFDQVHYFGVAQVWAVFFEGQATLVTGELSVSQKALIRNIQAIMEALDHAYGKGALLVQNL